MTKTLKIDDETHKRLLEMGSKADTFDDIITKLLDYYETAEGEE